MTFPTRATWSGLLLALFCGGCGAERAEPTTITTPIRVLVDEGLVISKPFYQENFGTCTDGDVVVTRTFHGKTLTIVFECKDSLSGIRTVFDIDTDTPGVIRECSLHYFYDKISAPKRQVDRTPVLVGTLVTSVADLSTRSPLSIAFEIRNPDYPSQPIVKGETVLHGL